MGWSFPWASSHGSDYNFDLDISRPEKATRAFLAGGSATLGDLLADGNPWLRRAELPGASRAGVLARNRGLRGVREGAGCRCVR